MSAALLFFLYKRYGDLAFVSANIGFLYVSLALGGVNGFYR